MAKSLGGFQRVENGRWKRLGGFWVGGFRLQGIKAYDLDILLLHYSNFYL